jgi:hypothetical protein
MYVRATHTAGRGERHRRNVGQRGAMGGDFPRYYAMVPGGSGIESSNLAAGVCGFCRFCRCHVGRKSQYSLGIRL